MKIKETQITLVQGDITQLKVDAIVNAANNKLLMGGGLAAAIKRQGGKQIEEEAIKKGPIAIGGAVATSAGRLSAKYVIHAATMGMDFRTDEEKIRSATASALKLADELKVKSIAFPALGCGVGGFPLLASAKIMAQEVFKHLREGKSGLKEIIFCLYDQQAYNAFQQGVIGYLEYVTYKLQNGPFLTVDAIIELDDGIVIIERKNPPFGWALPGGFVDYAESVEDAVRREVKEETSLEIEELKQFRVYSDPRRDSRFHTVAVVFIAKAKGRPQAGDDAANLRIIKPSEVRDIHFAFDHKQIILDYLKAKEKKDA